MREGAYWQAILLEPDPCNFRQLSNNIGRLTNKYQDLRPLALPIGAGSEYGCINLEAGGEASSLHSQAYAESANLHAVTVTPLDDIMPGGFVDFVKIDVEGHDREAL